MAAPSVVRTDVTLVTWLVWVVVVYREVEDGGVLWTGVPRKGVPKLGRFWFSSLVLFLMTSKGEVLRQRDLHLDQYFSSLREVMGDSIYMPTNKLSLHLQNLGSISATARLHQRRTEDSQVVIMCGLVQYYSD